MDTLEMTVMTDQKGYLRVLKGTILRLEKELTEDLAGYLIASHLGANFDSRHIGGPTESADCLLSRAYIECGIVEVMTHTNPVHKALFAEILKSPGGEKLQLPNGSGAWATEMTLDLKLKYLTVNRIIELLDRLKMTNVNHLHRDYSWPTNSELELLRDLGLKSIRRVDSDEDFIFRFMPLVGGQIDDSEDLLADYAEEIINDPNLEPKLARLSQRAGYLQRHFCIVVDSNSGISVDWRMNSQSLVPPLPSRDISLPDSVDSVWVMSMQAGRVLRYSNNEGWSDYVEETFVNPWWSQLERHKVQEINELTARYHAMISCNRNRPNA